MSRCRKATDYPKEHQLKRLLAIVISMSLALALLPPDHAAASTGICIVHADNPHKSTHVVNTINTIGRVECTYKPQVLDIDIRLQKRVLGVWVTWSSSPSPGYWTLYNSGKSVKDNRQRTCSSGTWRALVRGYASGPAGQPAVWSPSWAVSQTVTISC